MRAHGRLAGAGWSALLGATAASCTGASATELHGPVGRDAAGAEPISGLPSEAFAVCDEEDEPNDDEEEATAFTSCIEGELARKDVDHVVTVAPPNVTRVSIAHAEGGGDVWYRVILNGVEFPTFDDDAPEFLPAIGAGTYVVRIWPKGKSAERRTYRLHVAFE